MEEMLLTPETPLLVYGAGEVGRRFAARALAEGYNILGFFDEKLAGGSCDGRPVFDFAAPLPGPPDKNGVVICLADGLAHKGVAEALAAAGFSFIVLLPLGLARPPAEKDALTRLYNRVLNLRRGDSFKVPRYEALAKPAVVPEAAVLRRENGCLTVLVEAEILFTENKSTWKGDKSKLFGAPRYSDVNIAAHGGLAALFAYLSGAAPDGQGYLDGYRSDLANFKVDMAKRGELYDLFCRELDRGLDFFIEAAPEAEWSEQGYFNLIGGHHRTGFLVFRRHRLLPVRLSEADFERWLNRPALAAALNLLSEGRELYAPLPHPAFRAWPVRREGRMDSVYSALYAHIGPEGLADETVFDFCDDQGYYAGLLARLRAGQVRLFAPDPAKAGLASALGALLRLPRFRVEIGEPEAAAACSFLVLMDRGLDIPASEKAALIARAEALTAGRLLWESYAEDFEADRGALLAGGFKRCEVLTRLVVAGRCRTVAIFSKQAR